MPGYDPNFLAVPVPLPDFSPALAGDVLRKPDLRDGVYADYVNYTVAMHRGFRTPLFAALNINQKLHKTTETSGYWRTDSRIGGENQLGRGYYDGTDNPWDKGHLARRETAAWGETLKLAERADKETYYYSNASLQHANLNRDEWLGVEDWVLDLALDRDDKISSFSGPVFGAHMRTIRPDGQPVAFVPSAFYKVVYFMNRQDELEVRAFLVPQDEEAMRDRRGRRTYNYQTYQVTIAEIEEKTGLDFPEVLAERNPLFFNPSDTAAALNVTSFPERREVNSRIDIVRDNANPRALDFADDEVDVFIAAAMINPRGDERAGEWVSIINLGAAPENLDGWTLRDGEGRRKELSGTLDIGEAIRIGDLGAVRFANNRDGFVQLVDNRDRQIDRVPYTKAQAQREGKPIVFAYRDLDYDAAGS